MPGPASPGIWSVFQPAADVGGLAGRVPAQTCGQAAVTLTQVPGRRARRPGGQLGGQLESSRRAVLPGPLAEPAEPLAEHADANPGGRQRRPARPMPFQSGRPGSGRAGRLARWDFHWKRCRHALMRELSALPLRMLMHWPASSFVIFEDCLSYGQISSPGLSCPPGGQIGGSGRISRGVDVSVGGRVGRLHCACSHAAHFAAKDTLAGTSAPGRRRGVPPGRWLGPASASPPQPGHQGRKRSTSGGGGEGVAGRADWLGQCCRDAATLRCLPPGSCRGRWGRPAWLSCRGTRRCGGGR